MVAESFRELSKLQMVVSILMDADNWDCFTIQAGLR